jgi:Na+-transporting methylmalonyl-CoA/oxaloacetate decarboxylase beta subunit
MKPKVFIFANTHKEEINPMFGPSGVSIVHSLP